MAATALGIALVAGAEAQVQPYELTSETRALLSRLKAMGHRPTTAAEFNEVVDQVHGMVERAETAGDYDTMIEVTVLLSRVYSDMLGNHPQALKILREMKTYVADKEVRAMPQLYVRLTEVLAKQGDEEQIRNLIQEFRAGPYYDPEQYSVKGGTGPDDPLRIHRPLGSGDDSVSVTAMNRALQGARSAPGKQFPLRAALGDLDPSLQGKRLLLDFWHPEWIAWKRDLPTLKSVYRRYRAAGFEVLGIPLGMTPEEAREAALARDMPWAQVSATPELMRMAGVAGEVTNLLVDPEGTILGRHLYGQALIDAVESTTSP